MCVLLLFCSYLDHDNVGSVLLSQFFQNWSNHFAWSAPSGKEVDDDNLVTSIFHLLIEISLYMQRKKKREKCRIKNKQWSQDPSANDRHHCLCHFIARFAVPFVMIDEITSFSQTFNSTESNASREKNNKKKKKEKMTNHEKEREKTWALQPWITTSSPKWVITKEFYLLVPRTRRTRANTHRHCIISWSLLLLLFLCHFYYCVCVLRKEVVFCHEHLITEMKQVCNICSRALFLAPSVSTWFVLKLLDLVCSHSITNLTFDFKHLDLADTQQFIL